MCQVKLRQCHVSFLPKDSRPRIADRQTLALTSAGTRTRCPCTSRRCFSTTFTTRRAQENAQGHKSAGVCPESLTFPVGEAENERASSWKGCAFQERSPCACRTRSWCLPFWTRPFRASPVSRFGDPFWIPGRDRGGGDLLKPTNQRAVHLVRVSLKVLFHSSSPGCSPKCSARTVLLLAIPTGVTFFENSNVNCNAGFSSHPCVEYLAGNGVM